MSSGIISPPIPLSLACLSSLKGTIAFSAVVAGIEAVILPSLSVTGVASLATLPSAWLLTKL